MTGEPSRAELIAAVAERTTAADRTESPTDLDAAADALDALLAELHRRCPRDRPRRRLAGAAPPAPPRRVHRPRPALADRLRAVVVALDRPLAV